MKRPNQFFEKPVACNVLKTRRLKHKQVAKNAGELTHVVHRYLQFRFCNRHLTRVDLAQHLSCIFIRRLYST